jgi:2-polyprenyl-3-methyl-5-hydroxy-6-metoxy-1,4-benzoquinol methylase
MVLSPITERPNVELVDRIQRKWIIDLYRRNLDVDVTHFFATTESVDLYECRDTGYRFYHPFSLAGGPDLYATLQRIPWYYAEGKREHLYGIEAIGTAKRILEVGCGSGVFLRGLRERQCDVVGLDLNAIALDTARSRGLRVLNETVDQHARNHPEEYDVVATFQVLEHVAGVRSFLDSCVAALKPGGLLLVSVPNNDGAYHKHHHDPLNMPPHHMGLWTVNSLIALQSYFPIVLEKFFVDTDTPAWWVHARAVNVATQRLRRRCGPIAPLITRLARRFIIVGAESMMDFMPGQTIMAIFSKRVVCGPGNGLSRIAASRREGNLR